MFDESRIIEYGVRILIIFMILPLHECAHAWSAKKLGDHTAEYQGRLTLNPIAHIDPIGSLCLILTGFGWAKPVPINPLNFRKYRAGIALTAAAGPISNLIAAFIGMIAFRFVMAIPYGGETLIDFLNQTGPLYFAYLILSYFISINIGLAIFNLIPIPPLDGSKVLSYFTSAEFDRKVQQYQMYIYVVFLVVMFTGILNTPLNFISGLIYDLFVFLTDWIPLLVNVFVK